MLYPLTGTCRSNRRAGSRMKVRPGTAWFRYMCRERCSGYAWLTDEEKAPGLDRGFPEGLRGAVLSASPTLNARIATEPLAEQVIEGTITRAFRISVLFRIRGRKHRIPRRKRMPYRVERTA